MRIALCLAGLVGNLERFGKGDKLDISFAYNHFRKHIFNTNNSVDIFIHSWSTEFEQKICDLYQPKRFIFEKQLYFGRSSTYINNNKAVFAIESRINSCRKVINLVIDYEIKNNYKYDYVMICRFDIAFLSNIYFNKLPINKLIISNWNNRGEENNHTFGVYDSWFIGNTEIFNKILNIDNTNFNLRNHKYWKFIIDKSNIKPWHYLYIGKDYELIRRYYYNGEGRDRGTYKYPDIEKNWDIYNKNYKN